MFETDLALATRSTCRAASSTRRPRSRARRCTSPSASWRRPSTTCCAKSSIGPATTSPSAPASRLATSSTGTRRSTRSRRRCPTSSVGSAARPGGRRRRGERTVLGPPHSPARRSARRDQRTRPNRRHDVVRRRAPGPVAIGHEDDGRLRLTLGDRRLLLPGALEPAVRRLLDGRPGRSPTWPTCSTPTAGRCWCDGWSGKASCGPPPAQAPPVAERPGLRCAPESLARRASDRDGLAGPALDDRRATRGMGSRGARGEQARPDTATALAETARAQGVRVLLARRRANRGAGATRTVYLAHSGAERWWLEQVDVDAATEGPARARPRGAGVPEPTGAGCPDRPRSTWCARTAGMIRAAPTSAAP